MSKSKFIALVSLLSAFSGTLQVFVAPITFPILGGLPFGHDLIVFFPIILSVWIVGRFGAATGVGIISTLIVLFLNSSLFFVVGFAIAAFIFDLLLFVVEHRVTFKMSNILAVSLSMILSFFIGGFILGLLITSGSFPLSLTYWAPLHTLGGAIGLIVSYPLLAALERTGVRKSYGF
ncbi:MAG: hypothetical protein ABSB40_06485 [Nitrososphaeria archaeon]